MSSSPEHAKHRDHHLKKGGNRNNFPRNLDRANSSIEKQAAEKAATGRHRENHTGTLCTIKIAETNKSTH